MTFDSSAIVTTPLAAAMLELLPGVTSGDVALSGDQFRAIQRLYGFTPEPSGERPSPPKPPTREDYSEKWRFDDAVRAHNLAIGRTWEDPRAFMQAGADRNAIRHAQCDGLRMVAWIAKFVPAGMDPLKTLIGLAVDGGFDVSPEDIEFAECDDDGASATAEVTT